MTRSVQFRSRALRLTAALLAAPIALSPILSTPAAAQWIVYDPTNYAQNVLTAAPGPSSTRIRAHPDALEAPPRAR